MRGAIEGESWLRQLLPRRVVAAAVPAPENLVRGRSRDGETAAVDDWWRAALDDVVVAHRSGPRCTPDAAARGVGRGELVRLFRGVYLPAGRAEELSRTQLDDLRMRACATFGIVRQPLARASAARIWGIPLIARRGSGPSVEALAWNAKATRVSGDVRYWASIDPAMHVVERDGIQVTDLPRTLAELAFSESFATSVAAIDWAIRVRARPGARTTLEDIRAAADALEVTRGRARLERALEFADGRSESPGESLARVRFHELGFEPPALQHEYRLPSGEVFRSDFRWDSVNLAGEFDGMAKYKAAELRGGRTAEEVVVDEKLREDAIRSTGDGMLRMIWMDLFSDARLTGVLTRGRVPRRRRRSSRSSHAGSHVAGAWE